MFISGKTGSGKTHLACAILADLFYRGKIADKKGTIKRQDFITAPELLLKIKHTFDGHGDEAELISWYSFGDLLVLDDFGAEKASDWSNNVLYVILNRRYRNCLPTIITSNLSPQEVENEHGARIASRIMCGNIFVIDAPDYRKKK